VVTPACVYGVELVEVNDPYQFWYVNSQPSFDLILRDSGDCPWPDDTVLALVSKNTLGWPQSWLIEGAGADQTATVAIELVAPDSPQTLLLAWQLQGPDGEFIGSEITRTLRIGQRPTATPTSSPAVQPTQPPGQSQPPQPGPTQPSQPEPTEKFTPPPP
jgi:hypothetical protein